MVLKGACIKKNLLGQLLRGGPGLGLEGGPGLGSRGPGLGLELGARVWAREVKNTKNTKTINITQKHKK